MRRSVTRITEGPADLLYFKSHDRIRIGEWRPVG